MDIYNKIFNLIKRFYIARVSKNTQPYQLINDKNQKSTLLSPYGLTSCPISSSEGLSFSLCGNDERMFTMPYNPSITPEAEDGDVILFSNKTTKITLKKNKNIIIENGKVNITINNDGEFLLEAEEGKITIDKDGKAIFEGSAEIKIGDGAIEPAVLGTTFQSLFNAFIGVYNVHTHTANGVPPTQQASSSTGLELSTKVKIE